VPSVASEASAVRHAHLGQGPRSNFPSAEPANQANPFAALVDGPSDTALPPKSPPPASPGPSSQKPAARPQDGHVTQAPSAEAAPGAQKSPSDNPAAGGQAGVSASTGPRGTDTAGTAPGASAKNADTKSAVNLNVDQTIANLAAAATAANTVVDTTAGNSTTAAVTDGHGDKTAKSNSSASDTAQAASPPADPSTSQPVPAVPQPVAVAVSAPVIPAAPTPTGTGSGPGPDAGQISALSDAMKAGAARGKADRAGAEAAKGGSATAGTQQTGTATAGAQTGGADSQIGGATKPGTKTADTVAPAPSGPPQPTQKDNLSAAAQGQPNAADAAQSRNAEAVPATEAATNRARQLAAGTPGPQSNPNDNQNGNSIGNSNVDPNRDQAGSVKLIEDITRQALDPTARPIEALTAENAGGGTSRAGSGQAGSAQPAPDGSAGGLIAPSSQNPVLAATGAPTTAATPTAIPIAGLAVEITAHARAGKNRFEIRLDPPELGRIDVRLDVDHQGKVTSHVVVDRVETLDILRRDAPQLERSLQDAGLNTADNALQFSLRDHGGFAGQNPYPQNGSPAGATRVVVPDRELPPVDATAAGYGRAIGSRAGIDIRV
jgi:flagellar hook-length control protein FliK